MFSDDVEYSVIGKRVPKADAIYKATGQAKYIEDVFLPGMLHGKILRSPYPHARLLRIDFSRAAKVPGVKAAITSADTTKVKYCQMPISPNKMALADEKVRFIGDEIAAVAAIDEEVAEEAINLIQVEYEILPSVFDPEKAMEADAPQIHADSPNNIAAHFVRTFGDMEKGFREADLILEDRFTCPPVAPCVLEPHGCIAAFDVAGKLTIWTSTQNPYNVQRALAIILKIPLHHVRVLNTTVGGGFGNKSTILSIEPIAAFLSQKTNRPVKILNSRHEEFTTARTRYGMVIYLKTGLKRDGTLTAREAKVITDNGAYNNKGPGITSVTCNRIGNLYRVPNTRTEAFVVYTNNQSGDALRGWGGPQAHFAVESQMDRIAEALELDPVDFRIRNANQSGDVTPWGWQITSCGFIECLQEAAKMVDWRQKRKNRPLGKGIGIAGAIHTGGGSTGTHGKGNYSEVSLKINSDGTVHLTTGDSEIGQGSDTVFAQIIAEELGVAVEDVKVISTDTDITPVGMGTWGSRVTFVGGNAAKGAAEMAKRQLLEMAAEMLEADISDLEIKNRQIHLKGKPQKSLTLSEVAHTCIVKRGKPITSKMTYQPEHTQAPDPQTAYGNYCPAYGFGVQIAEVKVDLETGRVKVERIAAAYDVGKAINPMLIEGQIQGGIAMGMGYALLENLQVEKGKVLNPNFCTYKIVNSTEIPAIKIHLVETIDPYGPFGAKGIGELATIPTAPAIANAIYHATGARIKDLPITPEKILEALKNRREGKQEEMGSRGKA